MCVVAAASHHHHTSHSRSYRQRERPVNSCEAVGEKNGGGEAAALISQFIFLLFCISGQAPIGIDAIDMNRQTKFP